MKKNMCKFLALVLVFALMLAGCGGKDKSESAGKVEAPAVTPTVAPTTEPTLPENPLDLGRLEGGTYTNTYAGFGCTLDTSWTFYSAEELQQLPANVAEMLEDTPVGEVLGDYEQITDMMAENMDQLCTMNILYQKVPVKERLAAVAMGEEAFMSATMSQKDLMIQSYAQIGINVKIMELRKVSFLGEERWSLYTEGEMEGVPVYMVQLMDYSRGSYSITCTFTSYLDDKTQDMLDLFFVVE